MSPNKPGHAKGITEAAQLLRSSPGDIWPNRPQITTGTDFSLTKDGTEGICSSCGSRNELLL